MDRTMPGEIVFFLEGIVLSHGMPNDRSKILFNYPIHNVLEDSDNEMLSFTPPILRF